MELKQYLMFITRWAWLLVPVMLVCGTIAYAITATRPPMYESTTTLLVNQGMPDLNPQRLDNLVVGERRAITYSLLLTQRSVLAQVITNLGLRTDPGTLASRVTAEYLRNTELIILQVRDYDPKRSGRIANEIVAVFNAQGADLLGDPLAASLPSLHVVEAARDGLPLPPEAPRNAILAALVAFLLVIAIGMIYEFYDDRIRTAEEVEEITGEPALALIGRIKGRTPAARLVTASEPNSPITEAYRMFRAHLDLAGAQPHVVTLTSTAPGEGKSTTAANVAVALAQTGRRVVLVDADLRRPAIHEIFAVANTRGLANALQQPETSLDELLQPSTIENLSLLTSGPLPANPARLLGSSAFLQLLEALKARADVVLLDTPALLAVVDASLVIQASDATVLVIRAGRTRALTLRKAHSHLRKARARLLGIVLNHASAAALAATSYTDSGGGSSRPLLAGSTLMRAPLMPATDAAMHANDSSDQRQQAR